ncbi:MerR family transcriptional regulator [Demequina oxidasica]|uniref:MerR family transcriptional regulator n=1 Tax=Demequina oxidasica TaxID=676199 RepID=UPI0007825FC9|nr:MerR family transcriptional regulator [Demequina oxidasica]
MSTQEESELDIAAVARLSGTTSRTLRHYDAIGLLPPARTGRDGRRHYAQAELLRLQHILVLRELGTPLPTIQSIVDTDDDATTIALLREHRRGLERERDRFATLAATVAHTIESLEQGVAMTSDDILNGFDHDKYAPEARERWGAPVVDRAYTQWRDLGPDAQSAHLAEHEAISEAIAALASSDADPAGASAQEIVSRHFAWVSRLWTPNAESYTGLGQMYVDDERFRASYDKYGSGTAAFLRDAIAEYAKQLS